MIEIDYFSGFLLAISGEGLTPPKDVIADGNIYRFSSNGKPADKAGYYGFFINPNGLYAGFFGCWRKGVYSVWSSRHKSTLTKEELQWMETCKRKAELARNEVHADRAKYAERVFDIVESKPKTHPYLVKKRLITLGNIGLVSSLSCKDFFMDDSNSGWLRECLVIPVYNADGCIQSLQVITPNGDKFFMKGGSMKSGRFIFDGDTEHVYVCEGYATGSTIHQATGATVVVTFNASNLATVAPTLEAVFPDSTIIVAADNDHQKAKEGKGNKGREVAEMLFEQHNLAYTLPLFEDNDSGTDWNDFASDNQIDATTEALTCNLVTPPPIYDDFEATIDALEKNPDDEHAFDTAIEFLSDATKLQSSKMRKLLKQVSGADIGDIRNAVAEKNKQDTQDPLTHGQIADKYIFNYGQPQPVGVYGKLWDYKHVKGVWADVALAQIGVAVSKQFIGEEYCKRGSDYKAISSHIYDTIEHKDFFENAPYGLYLPSGFVFVEGIKIKKSPPCAEHCARFRLEIEPDFSKQPIKMLSMLEEAFNGRYPDEQIRQLRMLAGMTLFGLLPKEQRAVLLFGAAGSGKSLFLKILEALIPHEFRTSISPLDLDSDYKVAALAGKLVNLVPEIDKDKPIPSAQFKAITGGDTVSAREPYGKVFTFPPNTSCWFNGNFYPTTKDHTEGFWRRWTIVHFANTKPAQQRNPKLLSEIITEELPAFLAWAVQGTLDYLENGMYFSTAHNECLNEWKRDGNSVSSWLNDKDDSNVGDRQKASGKPPLRITHAYTIYKDWCQHNNRRPFNKQVFKVHMAAIGYAESTYNGYLSFTELYDARAMPANLMQIS